MCRRSDMVLVIHGYTFAGKEARHLFCNMQDDMAWAVQY